MIIGSAGMDREILLIEEPDVVTEIRTIAEILTTPVLERNADYKFVNAYHTPEYYLSRSFPALFPYGRGCPSDEDAEQRDYQKHTKIMLMRGGGPQARRCQKVPSYYFTMYLY